MAKDVRTHHWRAVERGQQQGSLTHFSQCFPSGQHIQILYAIVRMELRRIALGRLSARGSRIAMRAPCHPGEGSLHLAHADGPPCVAQLNPPGEEFHAPTFHIQNSVHRHFTSEYLTAGWERRTFQLLWLDISGSSDSAYLESFSLSIQCYGVLLKLPDISDRHLEIFPIDILRYFRPTS